MSCYGFVTQLQLRDGKRNMWIPGRSALYSISGVQQQIEKDLIQLTCITRHERHVGANVGGDGYAGTKGLAADLNDTVQDL
jgi:hypothetical protein